MSDPVRDTLEMPDGAIALLRWPARDKPRLLFAHANGFCASAYKRLLGRLASRFDIVAMDLRGHGRTRLPADPRTHHSWDIYGDDLIALCARLDRRPDLMAGHSMGAASSLIAASRMDTPPPLALVEPVVLPSLFYAAYRTPLRGLIRPRIGMGDLARKRTNGWPDCDTVARRYRERSTFADWRPGVVEDYLDDGLVEADGEVRLACDPEWEAANFEAQRHDLPGSIRLVGSGARVLKAQHRSTVRNTGRLRSQRVKIDTLPGAGHLAPMTHPDDVAAWIARTADHFGL